VLAGDGDNGGTNELEFIAWAIISGTGASPGIGPKLRRSISARKKSGDRWA
jgi:hypothetical protein